MKRLFVLLMALIVTLGVNAQEVNILLKEALNFERTQKENEALAKYNEVLKADKNNLKALVRSSELSSGMGSRQKDKKAKEAFYTNAKNFADAALLIDSNNADANYVRAVAAGKLTELDTDNKTIVANVRDIKLYADKTLALNPNHARANYVLGKWYFEMVDLAWAKRAAVKLFYGGLPDASIEKAINYMEKSRQLDQYFVLNSLDLAKAYKYDNKPARAIEVLNKLVKLPIRTADDSALKDEGRTLLSQMQ